MNKNTIILLLIFILPMVLYFYLSKNNNSNVTVSKITKPAIIKFTSELCSECQKMEKVIKEVYPKYSTDIELIEIPVQSPNDYSREMIAKYKVTLVPTIILLDKDKNITKRLEGYTDNETFENYLKELKND